MKLPERVIQTVVEAVGEAPVTARSLAGGCVNEAAQVCTRSHTLFAKWNASPPPGLFAEEALGLGLLRATETVAVPEVVATTDHTLLLAWVEPASSRESSMEDAGRSLALLHAKRGHEPGLHVQGFVGSLTQDNRPVEPPTWLSFFLERRIAPLVSELPVALRRRVAALDLRTLLREPEGGCSLLHGDLWGGNLLTGEDGKGWFVDPAAYYGHPEVDLAMTTLFGGFSPAFYDAYQEVAGAFDSDLQDRLQLLNLYPILVHVHLFGGGYLAQVDALARRYGSH